MATEPTFIIVAKEDIQSAMVASGKSTSASNTVQKQDGIVWGQTVTILMERVAISEVSRDTSKDGITKLRNHLIGIMANHIMATCTLPEDGKNRQGKTFKISNPDGTIKWSSWDQTRRIWSYIGDVAKIIAFGKEGELYPEKFKVAARCDILSQCKAEETTSAAIARLTSALQDVLLPLSDTAEVADAFGKVSALNIPAVSRLDIINAAIAKIDATLGTCTPTEIAEVASSLNRLGKHF